ncbi:hypothetical protein GCM10027579_10290 [Calidifontibacter terrae]
MALAAADTYVVVLALPDMMKGVGLGIDALQKATPIVSGFLLGYIAVLPLIGRLADLRDRQRILLWCLALFGVGSTITAISVDLDVLVAGRVLQGIGGGGLVPATLAIVASLWAPGERGTAFGVVGAVQEIGSVLGPLLGALILHVWDWRAIFWVNAAGALALAILIRVTGGPTARKEGPVISRWWLALTALVGLVTVVLLGLALIAPSALTTSIAYGDPFVPYAGHNARLMTPIGLWGLGALAALVAVSARYWWPTLRRADLVGALLIAIALGCLVLTFSSANPETQVVGPMGLWLLPLGAVAVAVYWWWHRRAQEPLIARGTVVGRVLPALVVSLLVGTSIVAIVVDIPILARLTVTDSQTEAAVILVRFLVAVPVGALVGGRLLRRTGPGVVAGIGLAAAALGLFAMSRWSGNALDTVAATIVLIVVGLGVGLAIAPVNDAALHDARESDHGVTSALIVVARMVGMVVGLALLTAIGLHQYYSEISGLAKPTEAAYRAAGVHQVNTVFLGAAIAATVAAGTALLLGRHAVRATQPAETLVNSKSM